MAPRPDPAHIEGSLLDPFLAPDDARRRLAAWRASGALAAVAPPSLLAELGPSEHGMRLFGSVGFPSGAHTLTSKRVELLEVARVEAWGAEVALTPHRLLGGPMGELEKEMKALLETAPDLEIRFAVEWSRIPPDARLRFLRLLKDFRPAALRISLGIYGPPPAPADVAALRPLLPKKTKLKVPAGGDAEVAALFAAGADLVELPEPFASGDAP